MFSDDGTEKGGGGTIVRMEINSLVWRKRSSSAKSFDSRFSYVAHLGMLADALSMVGILSATWWRAMFKVASLWMMQEAGSSVLFLARILVSLSGIPIRGDLLPSFIQFPHRGLGGVRSKFWSGESETKLGQ